MKRLVVLALAGALALFAVGCADGTDTAEPESESSASGVEGAEAPEARSADGLEAIPVEGPGESGAVAALPAALAEAKPMREGGGLPWPDLTGVEPIFNAYIISADMSGQVALLEVRADGIAHGIYAYRQPFDAGTLVWSPADYSTSPRTEPRGARETAAVGAVRTELSDAFPDATPNVAVYGYRFVYARDGEVLLILEVATDGSVISVGS